MPITSELEILQARGGHCGNGHLTSSGIAASETQHPQRQTLTLQTEGQTVEKNHRTFQVSLFKAEQFRFST